MYYTSNIGSLYEKIVSGNVTITNAGTAVRIISTKTVIGGIWLSSDVSQVGNTITVGDSNVKGIAGSQSGIVIIPGGQPIYLAINDLSQLYSV